MGPGRKCAAGGVAVEGWRALPSRPLGLVAMAAALVCGLTVWSSAALADSPLSWPTPVPIDQPNPLYGVSCPSSSLCVAVGTGSVVTTTDAVNGPWTVTPVGNLLDSISCPSTSLCVIGEGGFYDVQSSTDPTGGSGAWTKTTVQIPADFVSCPSTSLCVVADSGGSIVTSTNPGAASPTWSSPTPLSSTSPPNLHGLSCPSSSFCAATDSLGNVWTTTDPTGGGPWIPTDIDGTHPLSGISCASRSLCVAADESGNIFASTDPTAADPNWIAAQVDGINSIYAVSCASATLCVATDQSGNVVTSTDPTGAAAAWTVTRVDGSTDVLYGVSCASSSLCVAVDQNGFAITGTASTPRHTLSVTIGGSGSGRVAGDESPQIKCPGTCSEQYPSGTSVTLTALPSRGSRFAGWSGGGCPGTAPSCVVTVNADTSVRATFASSPPPRIHLKLSMPTTKPRAHLPFTIDPRGSTPGSGRFVNWRYTFGGLHGSSSLTGVNCPGTTPVVSAVVSTPVSGTLTVTATTSAGVSATSRVPYSVGGFNAADTARAASGTTGPAAMVTAACTKAPPTATHDHIRGQNIPRYILGCPGVVNAGLISAYGCFDEVSDLSQLPKSEGVELAKHAADFSHFFCSLFSSGCGGSDADIYFVADGPIKVNGLDVSPGPGGHVVIAIGGKDSAFATENAAYLVSVPGFVKLTGPGGAPLPLAGPVVDYDVNDIGRSSASVLDSPNIGDNFGSLPGVPWLKLTGELHVDWARCNESALEKTFTATATAPDAAAVTDDALRNCGQLNPGVTLINGNMGLPGGLFGLQDGQLTAGIGLFADNIHGLVLNGLYAVYNGTETLGPVTINGVKLVYQPSSDTLSAHVDAELNAEVANGKIGGDLAFVHGVPHLHLHFSGSPGITLLPQNLATITYADLNAPYTDPNGQTHDLNGEIHIALGGYADSTGCPLVGVDGVLSVDLQPLAIQGTSHQQFLCSDFGAANSFYLDDHSVALSGGFDYDIGDIFAIHTGLTGVAGIYAGKPHFQLDGVGSATLNYQPIHSMNSGEVVVSDRGMGVCLDAGLFGTHVGIGAHYDPTALVTFLIPPPIGPAGFATYLLADPADRITVQTDSCNIDQYRTIHGISPSRDTAPFEGDGARAAYAFTVPAHERVAIVRLRGATGAPAVTLHGPGGRVINMTGTRLVSTKTVYGFRDLLSHTTLVEVAGANAGRWTIDPAQGSPAVTAAQLSRQLSPPAVSGHVTGRGAHRVLRYSAHGLPTGARLTFFEIGSSGAPAPIGRSTTSLRGSIRFIPNVMAARGRTIVAEITRSDGTQVPHVVVTHYVTAPPTPAGVTGLHARRRGATLRITFRPSALATGYVVSVALHDGRRLMIPLGGRSHSVVVRSFARLDRVLAVTVRPVRDGRYGRIVRLRSPKRV